MLVKMNKTISGSPNGIIINKYEYGETYDLPESLYAVFVDELKVATPVIKRKEEKMETVPSNKSAHPEQDKSSEKKEEESEEEKDTVLLKKKRKHFS